MKKSVDGMSERIDISKELEKTNKELLLLYPRVKKSKKKNNKLSLDRRVKGWFFNKKVHPVMLKKSNEPITQFVTFQGAMRLLFFIGQCLGLNSVAGVFETDVTKIRFSILHWRFFYCVFLGLAQATEMLLSMYGLSKNSLSIAAVGYFAFYLSTCTTTFLNLHLARKWPGLMRELADISLNDYIDPSMRLKCFSTCIIILIFAIMEHCLSLISRFSHIRVRFSNLDPYDVFVKTTFAWYYELGLPENRPIGVLIQAVNWISTINWNYSDIFIICISIYLVSIQNQINKKIISASEKRYLPSSQWRSLREDYSKVTRLVRSFDDVISGIVFTSFANNLFFICLQIFNILVHGFKRYNSQNVNSTSGVLKGNEYTAYLVYSTIYLFVRSISVSLIAACVNSASLEPAAALYNVPSSAFCPEVARFLDQVHADKVALSGFQFFYVTRELVLSVAGTIVTYELVLLQVSGDETNSDAQL